MVFAPLTRRKHSLRTEALGGARVSALSLMDSAVDSSKKSAN